MHDLLFHIVENIEFWENRSQNSEFQRKLKNDLKQVKENENVYVKADKTTNFHKMSKETYKKHLDENIQKTYKKCNQTEVQNLLKEEKKIASQLGIADRMDMSPKSESYIQLKDHKPNYRNSPTFRLLNTNKSEIGKVAKQKLEQINENIRSKFKCNQWRSTQDVINWPKIIQYKKQYCINNLLERLSRDAM